MSLIFWKKNSDAYQHTVVTESTPLPVRAHKGDGEEEIQDVKVVQSYMPPMAGVSNTRKIQIPGISTGIYAAGDAFGTLITLPNMLRSGVNTGVVTRAVLIDRDDEGSQVDVSFWKHPMTTTDDNAVFAPNDIDVLSTEGAVSISVFYNWNVNQVGVWDGSHWVESQDTNLYIRCITQGTPTIAAGSEPWLLITVVPD